MPATRKREARKLLRRPAWITLDGGFAARRCVVQDISSAGRQDPRRTTQARCPAHCGWPLGAMRDGTKLSGDSGAAEIRSASNSSGEGRHDSLLDGAEDHARTRRFSRHRRRDELRKSGPAGKLREPALELRAVLAWRRLRRRASGGHRRPTAISAMVKSSPSMKRRVAS